MQSIIDYDQFMSERKIAHSDTVTNYTDAIELLVMTGADMVAYDTTEKLLLMSIGVLKADQDGNYYYEHNVSRQLDIISDIKVECPNVRVSYYIGGNKYNPEETKELVVACSMYHECNIRITFLEKPTNDLEFKIHYRIYLINTDIRKKMMYSRVQTKTNIYENGLCTPLAKMVQGPYH
jgi:hypothetical protein